MTSRPTFLPYFSALALLAGCSTVPSLSGQNPIEDTDDGGAGKAPTPPSEPNGPATDIIPGGEPGEEECPGQDSCEEAPPGCGDGKLRPGESCDDGNTVSGDGCTEECVGEADFACPEPGEPCVSTVSCGDGRISGTETCDDSGTESEDGCSAQCEIEPGWECPTVGARCRAKECGDGIIAGNEQCEDDDGAPAMGGDGCSEACRIEDGWVCEAAGESCREAICGDGVTEANESCDDGDDIHSGDGCSPGCLLEPDCSEGACTSACGDSLILPSDDEQCDDGNTLAGDGCSPTCEKEEGFSCKVGGQELPNELLIPIVYRDTITSPAAGAVAHPDFGVFTGEGATLGLVEPTLGADGNPVYTALCEQGSFMAANCPHGPQTTGEDNFKQWYEDVADVNISKLDYLTFTLDAASGAHVFDSGEGLLPFEAGGWVAAGKELTPFDHNFGFTSELRYWFEYKGGEVLEFSGDDDVWVFVNRKLAVDLGGLHPRRDASVTLDEAKAMELGLEVGKVYEIALFHAERRPDASNFKLSLGGFVGSQTECEPVCGDGIVVADELCDDGEENSEQLVPDVEYGKCAADCKSRGPFCGDGVVQEDFEECDNGANLDPYDGCAPGCVEAPRCGDGEVNSAFGEKCDDGNNVDGDRCSSLCQIEAQPPK